MKGIITILFVTVVLASACSNSNEQLAVTGESIYIENCKLCHGIIGDAMISGAKDLTKSTIALTDIQTVVTEGKRLMKPYKDVLSQDEIRMVSEYVLALRSE